MEAEVRGREGERHRVLAAVADFDRREERAVGGTVARPGEMARERLVDPTNGALGVRVLVAALGVVLEGAKGMGRPFWAEQRTYTVSKPTGPWGITEGWGVEPGVRFWQAANLGRASLGSRPR